MVIESLTVSKKQNDPMAARIDARIDEIRNDPEKAQALQLSVSAATTAERRRARDGKLAMARHRASMNKYTKEVRRTAKRQHLRRVNRRALPLRVGWCVYVFLGVPA